MQIDELTSKVRDTLTVRRVFGDPIEKDGVTIIPVASVMGGAGGGEGPARHVAGQTPEEEASASTGSGAAFGVSAKPAGVYVVKDGKVRWQPAIDPSRIAVLGQVTAIVIFLVVRSIVRSRAKAAAAAA